MQRGWLLLVLGCSAEGTCFSGKIRRTIPVRDPSLPIPERGIERLRDIVKNGIPSHDPTKTIETFELTAVCMCSNEPALAADGNHIAAKLSIMQAPCQGNLRLSTKIKYNVTEPNSCFISSVKLDQRKPVLSPLFIEIQSPQEYIPQVDLTPDKLVFKAGEFSLGDLSYYDVCNKDISSSSTPTSSEQTYDAEQGSTEDNRVRRHVDSAADSIHIMHDDL